MNKRCSKETDIPEEVLIQADQAQMVDIESRKFIAMRLDTVQKLFNEIARLQAVSFNMVVDTNKYIISFLEDKARFDQIFWDGAEDLFPENDLTTGYQFERRGDTVIIPAEIAARLITLKYQVE